MSSHFQFLGSTNYIGIDSKNNHTGAGAGAGAGNCYLLVVFLLHSLPPRHLFLASKILWEAISNSNF